MFPLFPPKKYISFFKNFFLFFFGKNTKPMGIMGTQGISMGTKDIYFWEQMGTIYFSMGTGTFIFVKNKEIKEYQSFSLPCYQK